MSLTRCRSACTSTACCPWRTWHSRGGPCPARSGLGPPSPFHSWKDIGYLCVIGRVVPVLCLQCVGPPVRFLCMVHHQRGRRAPLVLFCHHCEALAGTEHAVDRVGPGEHRRGLALAPDLPECCPANTYCLRAGLALVDGRGNCNS